MKQKGVRSIMEAGEWCSGLDDLIKHPRGHKPEANDGDGDGDGDGVPIAPEIVRLVCAATLATSAGHPAMGESLVQVAVIRMQNWLYDHLKKNVW